jgi:hypothetical protein
LTRIFHAAAAAAVYRWGGWSQLQSAPEGTVNAAAVTVAPEQPAAAGQPAEVAAADPAVAATAPVTGP